MKKIFFGLFALLLGANLYASSFVVSGHVLDQGGKPVADVKVTDGFRFVRTDQNGAYEIDVHDDATFVYLTVPAGYETPEWHGAPLFYRELDRTGKGQSVDFSLVKTGVDETRHIFMVWADVQVYEEEEIEYVKKAAEDAAQVADEAGVPAFGVSCGDITGDWWSGMSLDIQKATAQAGFPFFTLMGNHDYKGDAQTNEDSKKLYTDLYGPTYYSFDKGMAHYIVIDDVFNYTRHYIGYIEKHQLEWIRRDLADVPAGGLVVLFSHIPTYSWAATEDNWKDEQFNNILTNRQALYDILKPYDAHICSAHKHFAENYEIAPGLMEHNAAPLSGLFWQALIAADGVPWGYYVYEVDGSNLKWYFKPVGLPRETQFSAYRVGEDPEKRDCIVANVWNYDSQWKVEWSENGVPKGAMERYTGHDRAIMKDIHDRCEKEYKWKYLGPANSVHLFCAKPESPDSYVEITVTDRFGNVSKWNNSREIYKAGAYTWNSDSVVEGDKVARAQNVPKHPEFGVYSGASRLETYLYDLAVDELTLNKEKDGTYRTGQLWAGVWTRDISYSAILSLAHLDPEAMKTCLLKKVDKKNRIIQDTGTGGSWPCSTDREVWAAAAWEIYLETGSDAWLRQVYHIIRRSLDADRVVAFNPSTGLYRGESSFIDWREQSYPSWMQPVDIAQSECLGTNAVFYRALDVLSKMGERIGHKSDAKKYAAQAEALKASINSWFWMEDKGYYAQFIYGRNSRVLSPRSETLGESLCVLWGIADERQAAAILEKMPVAPYGPAVFSPQIAARDSAYHNNAVWPFVTSFYGKAAAMAGNRSALLHALGSNARAAAVFGSHMENFVASDGSTHTALDSPRQLWSIAGYIGLTRTALLGLNYEPGGIRFAPVVPESMLGARSLKGLKYRGMTLDISVIGEGSIIQSFKLDGEDAEPFVPNNLTGAHSVEITMGSDYYAAPDKVTVLPVQFDIDFPRAVIDGGMLVWKPVEGASGYTVLLDGARVGETAATSFELSEPGEYVVIARTIGGTHSFMSEPVRYGLVDIEIPCEALLGSRRGSQLKVVLIAPVTGTYWLDFNYSNGNGDLTTHQKCATRALYIDGKKVDSIVMPQRGTDWNEAGWTNSVKLDLTSGEHTFELKYVDETINMDIDTDTAFIHSLRLSYKNKE
ncbi:MAG: calcineurin-like phosphoesterase C-terminal domain-containing protein [Bacteroidales bacterium]|nr:calcineurin-like phosphoesterase C-terminal domain-containing protein [Bacteroidales bacterium]